MLAWLPLLLSSDNDDATQLACVALMCSACSPQHADQPQRDATVSAPLNTWQLEPTPQTAQTHAHSASTLVSSHRGGASELVPSRGSGQQLASSSVMSVSRSTKRTMGNRERVHASNVVKRFLFICIVRLRLRIICKNAVALRVAAWYRGYRSRRENKDEIERRRNALVMELYGSTRVVALDAVVPRHVRFLAARRIQLWHRRRVAERRVKHQRRVVAGRKIWSFYRQIAFQRYFAPAVVASRRSDRCRKAFAAVRIQALARGFLCRLWFHRERRALELAVANRYPVQQRTRRRESLQLLQDTLQHSIANEEARVVKEAVLARIHNARNPNREVVAWSAQNVRTDTGLVVDSALGLSSPQLPPPQQQQLHAHSHHKVSLAMVPVLKGDNTSFVSQARPVEPSDAAKYIEKCSTVELRSRIRFAKQEAERMTRRQLEAQERSVGKYHTESLYMQYALDAFDKCMGGGVEDGKKAE